MGQHSAKRASKSYLCSETPVETITWLPVMCLPFSECGVGRCRAWIMAWTPLHTALRMEICHPEQLGISKERKIPQAFNLCLPESTWRLSSAGAIHKNSSICFDSEVPITTELACLSNGQGGWISRVFERPARNIESSNKEKYFGFKAFVHAIMFWLSMRTKSHNALK